MKQFRLVNNVLGWVAFLVAAVVYCSTIEPTASFWDCPEFIVTGSRLEVGHPPGAPFFMLTANLFSQFASDPSQIALMVNTMSALLSASCILFLFWSITHLTRKLIWNETSPTPSDGGEPQMPLGKLIAIEASGLVGALIYTFSDTFWFSAVEGEVYAYSSALTALVFWLILKWEDHADEPHSDRWLVLITYITGLSIGVHLLNLLCVPAIVLVYYYKKYPNANLKGSLIALCISFVIVAAILYGVVPGIITVGGAFELLFVNQLGMPFNTGLIIYILLLVAIVIWAIYESQLDKSPLRQNIAFLAAVAMLGIPFYGYGWKALLIGIVILVALWFVINLKREKQLLVTARAKNTTLLCMLMLMIGYSTYGVIVIRSSANPPMDQNSPEDIFTLGTYLGRDQYGNRPLFYGQAYTSEVDFVRDGEYCKPHVVDGAPIWQQKEKASPDEKDSYFIVTHKTDYKYAQNMLFPRMYDRAHAQSYTSWMSGAPSWLPSGRDVAYDRCGEAVTVHMPSQAENIFFFLSYQCNFMYWRYFMWNFAGRQNDIQGNGELEHGNWLTGFSFIDNARLGNQDLLPDDLKNNKGHNVFYCLPLLLGLIGLFWQAYRGQRGIRQFWVVFFLFFMTGLAIVFYLNQTPNQPRERDYAYAGSFYAFAIWCGMGVAAIYDLLKKRLKGVNGTLVAAVVGIVCLLVPIQMASQTWDDHDRSGRYCCRDFGQNYLMSLQDQGYPIIYTNGDNDTFPLWYNQDVEGVRTDARVCNLSYLQTDWYIDQMVRPAYESPSLPITWPRIDYCNGTNDYIEINPDVKAQVMEFYQENREEAVKTFGEEPFELKNILDRWVRSDNPDMHFIPTDTLYMTIDKEAVRKSGMMMAADSIPDKMIISLAGKRALYKGDLMMLEMIANANWTRPIYVAMTVGSENYMNLGDNFVQEGLVYRITPFTTINDNVSDFDTEKVYNNVMTRFKYGGLDKPGLYLDETVMRMCGTHRHLFAQLCKNLILEKKNDKALKALQYCDKMIPAYNVPYTYISGAADMAWCYGKLGKMKEAKNIMNAIVKNSQQYLNWYMSLGFNSMQSYQRECMMHLYILRNCAEQALDFDQAYGNELIQKFEKLAGQYEQLGGSFNQQ